MWGWPANSDDAANLVRLDDLDVVGFVGRVVRLDDLDHLTCEMGTQRQEN